VRQTAHTRVAISTGPGRGSGSPAGVSLCPGAVSSCARIASIRGMMVGRSILNRLLSETAQRIVPWRPPEWRGVRTIGDADDGTLALRLGISGREFTGVTPHASTSVIDSAAMRPGTP
jgi:hypothetical protein